MGLISRVKDWQDKEVLTEEDLDAEFDNITDSIVDATTSAKGLVMLEDSHASTSVTKAACPKNVKEAYDLAGTMLTKATFNANTFIYAVSDNTPVIKTRAEVMALLSGQAAANFAMNTHKITGVVDPTTDQEAATKKYVDDNIGSVSDAVYAAAWNGVTTIASSKNAIYDKIETLIPKSLFNAHTLIKADSDNTPIILEVAASRLVGRTSGSAIEDLAKADVLTLLNVEDGADVTDATNVNAAGAVMNSDYNANTFLYAVSSNTPIVKTRAEVMGLLSGQAAGAFDFADQNLTNVGTVALDGGQIAFPATAVPSANANTLDDYEEGTFTPTLYGTTTAGTPTYTTQVGRYTKIGNRIQCQLRIVISAKGGIDGNVRISGLPFTTKSTVNSYNPLLIGYCAGAVITAGTTIMGYTNLNATNISLTIWDSTAGTVNLDDAKIGDTFDIMASINYETA